MLSLWIDPLGAGIDPLEEGVLPFKVRVDPIEEGLVPSAVGASHFLGIKEARRQISEPCRSQVENGGGEGGI